MEDHYFVAAGVGIDGDRHYITNFDPLLWTDDISRAKKVYVISNIIFDIRLYEDTFKDIFERNYIVSVNVYEIFSDGHMQEISEVLKKGKW